jgi:hypothetical protein
MNRRRRPLTPGVSFLRSELRALRRALIEIHGEVVLTRRDLNAQRNAATIDRQLPLFPDELEPRIKFCAYEDCDQSPDVDGMCLHHAREAVQQEAEEAARRMRLREEQPYPFHEGPYRDEDDEDPRCCVYAACDEPPESSGYCRHHERVLRVRVIHPEADR